MDTVRGVFCRILAVDFLNVLVRAFHAGKPTETHAVRSMFQTVASAIRTLQPEIVVFAMDGGHKHRSELLPSYKAHRPPMPPELVKQMELAAQAIALAGWQAIRVQDFEADDVIASIVAKHSGVVVCSCDKDLLALAGRARIYHPWKGGEFVTPEDKLGLPAGQVTDYLSLCGDHSDGIPGILGVGPKTALKLLTEFGTLEGVLAAAATGKIPGAMSAVIKSQSAEALTCRAVVQMRDSLTLPELKNTPLAAGWQWRLELLRLGSVAAIIESLENTPLKDDGQTSSAATGKAERVDVGAADNPERSAASGRIDHPPGLEKPGDGRSKEAETVAGIVTSETPQRTRPAGKSAATRTLF